MAPDGPPLKFKDVYYFMPKRWCACGICTMILGFWVVSSGLFALGTADVEGKARDKKVAAFNSAVDNWDKQDYQSFVNAIGGRFAANAPTAQLPLVSLNVSRSGSEVARLDAVAALPPQSKVFDVLSDAEHDDGMKALSKNKRVYYAVDAVRILPESAPPGAVQLALPSSGGRLQIHRTADLQLTFPPPEDAARPNNSTITINFLPTVISVATQDPLCSNKQSDELDCPNRCDTNDGFAQSGRCIQFFRAQSICMTLASSTGAPSAQNTSRLFNMTGTNALSPGSARTETARIGCAQQHELLTEGAMRRAGVSTPPAFARLVVAGSDAVSAVAYAPVPVDSLAAAFGQSVDFPLVEVAWMADADPYAAALRATDGTLDFGTPSELIVGAAVFLIGLGLVQCCCGVGVGTSKYYGARSKLAGYVAHAAAQGNTPDQLMAVVLDQDRVLRSLPSSQRPEFRMHNGIAKWLRMLREQTNFATATPVRTGNPLGTRPASASVAPLQGVELTATSSQQRSQNTQAHKEQATIATMPGSAGPAQSPPNAYPPPGVSGGASTTAYPMAASSYPVPQYASTEGSFGAYGNLGGAGGGQAPMASGPYYPPPSYGQGGVSGADVAYPSHK